MEKGTKTARTAGPWKLSEGQSVVARWEDGQEVQVCCMNHTHWSHEPDGDGSSYDNNQRMSAESKANGPLIAAAPDLLKALQMAYEWEKDCPVFEAVCPKCQWKKKAGAAIRAATGTEV